MEITGAVLEELGRPAPYARSRPLTVGPLELDPPGPGELLVEVEAAGVCHSDLSVVDGSRPRPVPVLLGHEAAGLVRELGPGVDDVAVGDRVVLTFLPRCGRCAACATDGRLPCAAGSAANAAGTLLGGARRLRRRGEDGRHQDVAHHLGVSAFATHAVVARASVVPVGPDVPADVAALLGCAVLTGGGAVLNAGRPAEGERVVVVGLGGVGLAAVLVARALGHEVVGVDALESKLETARPYAADVMTPPEVLERGLTAPVVVEAAGAARALETALAATAEGGTTVTVGLPPADARASVSPLALVAGARSVVGSYLGSSVPSRDVPRYAQLRREGRLPLEALLSGRLPLSRVDEAMDDLAEGRALRQVLVPGPA